MDIWRSEDDTFGGSAARPAVTPLPLPSPSPLPFRGRAESYQLLGVGRLEVARRLCDPRGLSPIRCGDQAWALVQLSLMKWKQSPVGPYWASFVGIAVGTGDGGDGVRARGERPPGATAVLSAFLRSPKALLAPAYVVGDVAGTPPGGATRSSAFGTDVLGIEKWPATFTVRTTPRLTHLQVLQRRRRADGTAIVTGYALSLSVPRPRAGMTLPALPISPALLLTPGLVTGSLRAFVEPELRGAFVFPAPGGGDGTVYVGTRFTSRPRLLDLSSDRRTVLTPLVMDRPAPADALGVLLDDLDFCPRVLMWDPDLAGTIVGTAPSLADALA
jgi:hypothetical protein